MLRATDGKYDESAPKLQPEYPTEIVAIVRSHVPVELPDLDVPSPGPDVPYISQLCLAPVHGRHLDEPATGIFVHILNFPSPPYGVVVPGGLPGNPVLPVVLREPLADPVAIWKLDRVFFSAVDEMVDLQDLG